jgi:hypothetical protein
MLQVSRRLALGSDALRVALLFLALDTLSDSRRWTLGPLGAIELEPQFTPHRDSSENASENASENGPRASSAPGRLCAPDGFTIGIEIVLTTTEASDARLTLRALPDDMHSDDGHSDDILSHEIDSDAHRDELLIAARAGLDELAEELLFFGTRQHH